MFQAKLLCPIPGSFRRKARVTTKPIMKWKLPTRSYFRQTYRDTNYRGFDLCWIRYSCRTESDLYTRTDFRSTPSEDSWAFLSTRPYIRLVVDRKLVFPPPPFKRQQSILYGIFSVNFLVPGFCRFQKPLILFIARYRLHSLELCSRPLWCYRSFETRHAIYELIRTGVGYKINK